MCVCAREHVCTSTCTCICKGWCTCAAFTVEIRVGTRCLPQLLLHLLFSSFFFLFFFFEISPSLEFPDSAKLTSQGSFCFCYPPVLVLQAHTEGAWSIPHLVLFLVWVWVFICVHKWAFNDKCTCGCENVKSRGQGPEYSLIIPHLSFQVGVSHWS